MSHKQRLFAAVCGLALCAIEPTAALAQQAAQDEQVPELETVIVTAQRRSENLQQVPISVSTASAAMLESVGVRSTGDLSTMAPAVTINPGVGGATVTIRGVGGTGSGSDEPSNAVYLDGVYQALPSTILFALNNIERIEILKGPQGTLFGRNASGGLIHVITRQPSFSPEFKAAVGYGNYETFRGAFYGNVPLGEKVAVNLAAVLDDPGEGWGENIATGRDTYKGRAIGIRSKALWEIDDNTSVLGAFLYSKNITASVQGGGILPGTRTATGFPQPAGFFDTNTEDETKSRSRQYNYALTVKREFSPFTFTSITSRDHTIGDITANVDRSPVPVLEANVRGEGDTWTQELQLAAPASSKVQWTLGAFYFNSQLDSLVHVLALVRGPGVYSDTASQAKTESYAAYGQATVPLGEKTRITAGLRYTADQRDIDFTTSGSPPTPSRTYPRQSTDSSKVTWRLAADHRVTEDALLYASYSRGFKSGLFNSTNPGLPPVEPQTVDAYEVGAKTEWLDGRVRLNLAAYYNDLQNIQVKGIPSGFTSPIFYNAPGAKIRGADIEFLAAVTSRLNVQANLAYNHARYSDGFTNALFITIPPAPAGGIIGGIGDASDNHVAFTPTWVASLSAQYTVPTAMGDIVLAGAYTYNGKLFYDAQNLVRRPVVNIFNASASWRASDAITLELWGNNLADEHYYAQAESSPPNAYVYYPAAPRTYGFTIKYAFQ